MEEIILKALAVANFSQVKTQYNRYLVKACLASSIQNTNGFFLFVHYRFEIVKLTNQFNIIGNDGHLLICKRETAVVFQSS
ncbi:hypothetical protein EFY79_01345 [Hanamia caeni]|uniref:Uncharacterized protein n=1 Tax=Hanamia caeni TaxID=2294116 RepID=A0A3M9NQD0_9BACT|nr:hypothetical protein EFY79_01345 [Hanamia caeni]